MTKLTRASSCHLMLLFISACIIIYCKFDVSGVKGSSSFAHRYWSESVDAYDEVLSTAFRKRKVEFFAGLVVGFGSCCVTYRPSSSCWKTLSSSSGVLFPTSNDDDKVNASLEAHPSSSAISVRRVALSRFRNEKILTSDWDLMGGTLNTLML
jgi:hypothetical protein